MKKQINISIRAQLLRSAFYVVLLLGVCVIPFALGQRGISNRNVPAHPPEISNVHGTAPAVLRKSPIAPFALIGPMGVVCPATITESTSQAIVDGNSVACNTGGLTSENHYWRAFDMKTFTGGQEYDVTSVSLGIELAQSGDGTGQALTVNLYANHGSQFPAGDWQSNLIATSGSLNIPDQTDSIFQTSLTATVPAGTLELVMEVMTPDGTAVGNAFFIGSNTDPETGPSYLSAPDCGVNDPTLTGDLGFPGMHIVMNVNGNCPNGSPTPTPTASVTPSVSPTPSGTPSVSPSPSGTPSVSPSPSGTPSVSPSPSGTPSVSPSPSGTPSVSPSPSGTPSVSPSPSVTPSASPSPSVTPSATPTPSVTPTVTPTPTPSGCVFSQGYWKNHPQAWPVTQLQLGNTTYTQEQLLAILHEPPRGNGILILAHQEIAAKLNIANGADGSCIQQTLADADALVGDLVIPPVGDGYLRPRDASPIAGILGDFNEGGMCAASCDNSSPSPSASPRATPRSRPPTHPRPAR